MSQAPYLYSKEHSTRYHFVSVGKRAVNKIVEFRPLKFDKIYNLAFGDLNSDDTIDDLAITNNADTSKVMSTIIQIVRDFSVSNPDIKIYFTGSTDQRTAFYQRIITMYFDDFIEEFDITAFEGDIKKPVEKIFNPKNANLYLAFFLKRKL